ncbi:hypothetical protein F5880DRAFT_1470818 [Lentinula raphanica]|nr:hypothetical protein F5880DRAFT_1470818 [Lentinula raphanica]
MAHCPVSTSKFTGREDILKILQDFFGVSGTVTAENKPNIFLLHGLGGAGKTQTTLEFAKRFKSSFSEVYFITANTEASIQGCYFDIATTNGATGTDTSWKAGLHWLHTHEKNWLIIIDNADDPKIDFKEYLPSCVHGNIIITSRNPELQVIATQSEELQDLLPEEAMFLLLKHAFKSLDSITPPQKEEAALIAQELHCFPLALVQAGAYICQQNCLFGYLDRLQSQRQEMLLRNPKYSIDRYGLSVYATWNLSWEQLSPDCKILLEVCAHLYYDWIPRALFQRGVANIKSVELPLGLTTSYSLMHIEYEAYYVFHPLVHQWLRDITNDSDKQLAVVGIILSALQNIYWKDFDVLDNMPQEEPEFLQVLAPHCQELTSNLIYGDVYYNLAIEELASILESLGKESEALPLEQELVEVTEKDLGKDHPHTLRRIQNMAITLRNLGRVEKALELQQKTLSLSKEVMGELHPITLAMTQDLAETLRNLSKANEALALEEEVLEISKNFWGEEHRRTLSITVDLALTLKTLGRTSEAYKLEQDLLTTAKRVLGDEHPDTLSVAQNLAITLKFLGKADEALELQQHLIEVSKRVLGVEHPKTLNIMVESTLSMVDLVGRSSEALELQQKLLEVSRKIQGDDHPHTLHIIHILAQTLIELGRLEEALILEQEVLDISKRVMGEQHPNTLNAIHILGALLSELGRPSEALEMQQNLVNISKELVGEEHPDTLSRIGKLAVTLKALGKVTDALRLEHNIVEVSKRVLGEKDPDTLDRIESYAVTLGMLGKVKEELKMEKDLLDISKSIFDEEDPCNLRRTMNLAVTLMTLGKANEAFQLEQGLLEKFKKVYGEEHTSTLIATQNVVTTLKKLGRLNEALELQQGLLEVSKKVLGEENPQTLIRTVDLIRTLHKMGKRSEASQLDKEFRAIAKNVPMEKRRKIPGAGAHTPSRLKAGQFFTKAMSRMFMKTTG